MDELDCETRAFLHTYPDEFIEEFHNDVEYGGLLGHEISIDVIKDFDQRTYGGIGQCRMQIQFINPKTESLTKFKTIMINLNNKGWYKSLCATVGVKQIFSKSGAVVEKLTREGVAANRCKFHAFTSFDKSKFTVHPKIGVSKLTCVRELWGKYLDGIIDSTSDMVCDLISKGTLSESLNNGSFMEVLREWTYEFFSNNSTFKSYGCKGIIDFQEHYCRSVMAIQDCTTKCYEQVILCLRYSMFLCKGFLRHLLAGLHFRQKEVKSQELKDALVRIFAVTKILNLDRNVFMHPFERRELSRLYNELQLEVGKIMWKMNTQHCLKLKEDDHSKHSEHLESMRCPYYHIDRHISQQTMRDLSEALTPYSKTDQERVDYFQKYYNFSKVRDHIGCECGKHIYLIKVKNGCTEFHPDNDVIHNNLRVHRTGDQMLVEIPNHEYAYFDPVASELITKDRTRIPFDEVFLKHKNLHLFFIHQE